MALMVLHGDRPAEFRRKPPDPYDQQRPVGVVPVGADCWLHDTTVSADTYPKVPSGRRTSHRAPPITLIHHVCAVRRDSHG